MAEKGNFPKREERVRYHGAVDERPRKPTGNKGKKPKKKVPPSGKKKSGKKSTIFRTRLLVCGILICIVLVVLFGLLRKNGAEVFVGEKSVGIIRDKSVKAEALEKTVTSQLEGEMGTKIKINETIKTVPVHISKSKKKNAGTLDYMMPLIRKAVTYQVQASVIMVESDRAAILKNKEEAQAVFDTVQAEYMEGLDPEKVTPSFVEDVKVVDEFVEHSQIMSKEQAVEKLQSTTSSQKEYTVKSGDSPFGIAQAADMTLEELIEVNPGLDINSGVKIGQKLNITVKKPYVSVKTVETQVVTEVEPMEVKYQEDNTKNKGYQKVIQKGKDGQKESTKQIIRINGLIDEEKEIDKKITVEPVDEIIVQGTK